MMNKILFFAALVPTLCFGSQAPSVSQNAYLCSLNLVQNTSLVVEVYLKTSDAEWIHFYQSSAELMKNRPEAAQSIADFLLSYFKLIKADPKAASEILHAQYARKILSEENNDRRVFFANVFTQTLEAGKNSSNPSYVSAFEAALKSKKLFIPFRGTGELKPMVDLPSQLKLSPEQIKKLYSARILSEYIDDTNRLFDALPESAHQGLNDLLQFIADSDRQVPGHRLSEYLFGQTAYRSYLEFTLDFFEKVQKGIYLADELVSPSQFLALLQATPAKFEMVLSLTFIATRRLDVDGAQGRVLRDLRVNYLKGGVDFGVVPEVRNFLGVKAPGSEPKTLLPDGVVDSEKRKIASTKFQSVLSARKEGTIGFELFKEKLKEVFQTDAVTAALFSDGAINEIAFQIFFTPAPFSGISFSRAVTYFRIIEAGRTHKLSDFQQGQKKSYVGPLTEIIDILAADPDFGTQLTPLQRELLAFDLFSSENNRYAVFRIREIELDRNLPSLLIQQPQTQGDKLANFLYETRFQSAPRQLVSQVFSAVFDNENVNAVTNETFRAGLKTLEYLNIPTNEKMQLVRKIIRYPNVTREAITMAMTVPLHWLFGVHRIRSDEYSSRYVIQAAGEFVPKNWTPELIAETVPLLIEIADALKGDALYESSVDYIARYVIDLGIEKSPNKALYRKLWDPFFKAHKTVNVKSWLRI